MGCQGFWGYLLKPRNFLILAITTILVFGIYKQVAPDSGLPAVIQILSIFENLPIEQSELREDTQGQQYAKVQKITFGTHVMKYGNTEMDDKNSMKQSKEPITVTPELHFDQQEASLQSLVQRVLRAPDGTLQQELAQKELDQELAHRAHMDCVIEQIAKAISSPNDFSWLIQTFPPNVVDDWNCFKTLLSTYETYRGGFSYYGIKYGNVFANMCNNGTQQSQLAEVASEEVELLHLKFVATLSRKVLKGCSQVVEIRNELNSIMLC